MSKQTNASSFRLRNVIALLAMSTLAISATQDAVTARTLGVLQIRERVLEEFHTSSEPLSSLDWHLQEFSEAEFAFDENKAFLLDAWQQVQAPNGFYMLPNGQTISVHNGDVRELRFLAQVLDSARFRQWLQRPFSLYIPLLKPVENEDTVSVQSAYQQAQLM